MKKINNVKQVYANNTIFQFLTSYVLILIIPFVVTTIGFQIAFGVVEKDIKNTNQYILEHGVSKIDKDLELIMSLGLKMIQSETLKDFASTEIEDSSYYTSAKKVMDEYYSTLRYQGISLLEDTYTYLNLRDKVLYENTLYRPEVFKRYLSHWGMSLEEWRTMCENNGERTPRYYVSNSGKIQYVMPFSRELRGDNIGALVFDISEEGIRNHLSFLEDYKEYSIFIIDSNGNEIWAADTLDYKDKLQEDWMIGSGTARTKHEDITYVASKELDWQYILVLPKQVALNQLITLKLIVSCLAVGAGLLGLCVSIVMSIRKGRPLNHLKEIFLNIDNTTSKDNMSLETMGEMVRDIITNNQSLLVEMEKDKPALQKAFFSDLIKAEFVSSTELNYMAKKAGIELMGTDYMVVSLKLFANNDFYEIDEQTMDEVRIIFQLVQHYIKDNYKDSVWFYKRHTFITLGIFQVSTASKDLIKTIGQTRDWLLHEYGIEASWGISQNCNNLLEAWKACEEARIAMESCQKDNNIVSYSVGLEALDEFYFPYIMEEKLMNSIKSGDEKGIQSLLGMLEEENFVKRSLNRSKFIKFNRRMTELFIHYEEMFPDIKDKIIWINETVIENYVEYKEYFYRVSLVCKELSKFEEKKKNAKRKKVIHEIIHYMEVNYMDSSLGLGKVGSEFGMSEGYLSSIFKEAAGRNFAEYLEQIRIETACALLRKEEDSISLISEKVGYNSIQSFRRAFKRVKGVSPKDYKEE